MRMFAAVSKESLQRLEDFNPQELSNLLIAFARMEIENVPLLDVSSCLTCMLKTRDKENLCCSRPSGVSRSSL